ncbi:ADP-ribosyl-(dinitrogen reductase) hydrolase [Polynucleobacter sp. JS-Safj-400b-B2]|uniref:ADP-ribosyl-(dinitrogen reductase) hydrolase n=1 Tax=Polynucleobacter sp. JS-Safj-400b-B2 TaxID=2576921 RepID=UPI001C0B4A64|nr:ADP-ribosyl-(dinitrogen reductase) hydrolase [Polynucleobacter sp. JS-Safj-400b-B2]MBU3626636.1 ADP-ribosyl-(dinitrogen reductase) hydrolase [Polynucleobacter sp. JS-Safj-400b-B2]
MQNLVISPAIHGKLELKHGISRSDVEQCFINRQRSYLVDNRLDHLTEPPTEWFISENDRGILIKVVFIFDNGMIYLKSAFPPNSTEIRIYNTISIPY